MPKPEAHVTLDNSKPLFFFLTVSCVSGCVSGCVTGGVGNCVAGCVSVSSCVASRVGGWLCV